MLEKTLEDLRDEATELGIEFPFNIGKEKLQAKVDEWYIARAKENEISDADNTVSSADAPTETPLTPIEQIARAAVQKAKAAMAKRIEAGKKTRIVKLTMVDKREASTATDAFFSNGSMQIRVPLDEFIEMPQALIDLAEDAKALIHVDGKDGAVPKLVKKYVVEYK